MLRRRCWLTVPMPSQTASVSPQKTPSLCN
jgi:hypothetical protein